MYLPPDANCLLSCFDHCIQSKNYINVIVASKHLSYQWLSMNEAVKHCKRELVFGNLQVMMEENQILSWLVVVIHRLLKHWLLSQF